MEVLHWIIFTFKCSSMQNITLKINEKTEKLIELFITVIKIRKKSLIKYLKRIFRNRCDSLTGIIKTFFCSRILIFCQEKTLKNKK